MSFCLTVRLSPCSYCILAYIVLKRRNRSSHRTKRRTKEVQRGHWGEQNQRKARAADERDRENIQLCTLRRSRKSDWWRSIRSSDRVSSTAARTRFRRRRPAVFCSCLRLFRSHHHRHPSASVNTLSAYLFPCLRYPANCCCCRGCRGRRRRRRSHSSPVVVVSSVRCRRCCRCL